MPTENSKDKRASCEGTFHIDKKALDLHASNIRILKAIAVFGTNLLAAAGSSLFFIPLLISVVCVAVIIRELHLRRMLFKYASLAKEKGYISVLGIADTFGLSRNQVVKELNRLKRAGMLPERLRFDKDSIIFLEDIVPGEDFEDCGSCLACMEGDECGKAVEPAGKTDEDTISEDVERTEDRYERLILKANELIAAGAMSEKLSVLQCLVSRIYEFAGENPETATRTRKLTNYYLPAITKLLNSYIELDRQKSLGIDVQDTEKEIEDSIDMANDALRNLLGSMLKDKGMDISADIAVMRSMIEQDGLSGQEFSI